MFQKNIFLIILLIMSFAIVGCDNDNSTPSIPVAVDEPDDDEDDIDDDVVEDSTPSRAVLSNVAINGGVLQETFSNDENAENTYIIDVARYNMTDALTIDVAPEEGATISATLSTDPDDTTSDVTLTGTSFTLDVADTTVTSVLTVVITKADQTTTTYTFTVDASSRSTLSDIQNIISLAGATLHADDMLGTDMDFDDSRIVVGLPGYDGTADGSTVTDSGAALVLSKTGTTWEATLLQPATLGASDAFGSTVAIQENIIVIGSPGDDGDASSTLAVSNDNLMNSGAVHVYEYDASSMSWNASHYVKSSSPVASGGFGALLDVWFASNNSSTAQIAVGSSGADTIEVFLRSVEVATENNPATDVFQLLGEALSAALDPLLLGNNPIELDRRILLFGQPSSNFSTSLVDSGKIIMHHRIGGPTTRFHYLSNFSSSGSQLTSNSHYGYSVSLHGSNILIGIPGVNNDGGRIDLFQISVESDRDGDNVNHYIYDTPTYSTSPSNRRSGDRFGHSVHLSTNTIIVGSLGNDGDATTTIDTVIDPDATDYVDNSGAIYTFYKEDDPDDPDDPLWELDTYLKSPDTQAEDAFGSVVHMTEDGRIVGISQRGVYLLQ